MDCKHLISYYECVSYNVKFSIKILYAKIRKTIVKAANSSAINVSIPVYSAL